jgi:deoxyribodipyrimidine photo-lyase
MVDPTRVTRLGAEAAHPARSYVLYWMIAQRRTRWNPALELALEHARTLGLPLVVLEPLSLDHTWASPRHLSFIVDGMRVNARRCAEAGVHYVAHVEAAAGEGRGLLPALAHHAALVVTDDYPTYFLPKMVRGAATHLDIPLLLVDGCGVVPMRGHDRSFTVAHSFRRHLQHILKPHLLDRPLAEPLSGYDLGKATIPATVSATWKLRTHPDELTWSAVSPAAPLPGPSPTGLVGGAEAAEAQMHAFLADRFLRYGSDRNHPDGDPSSGLSPYLHYGHLGAHELASAVLDLDQWHAGKLAAKPNGRRTDWWGASPWAESYLDQILTWRELGYAWCADNPRRAHDYDALPAWALQTLADHADDPRVVLDMATLEEARTEDEVWNAAQRQLVTEGRIHNYLRMLWGKKVLAWSATPEEAFQRLVILNDRYALDGRDPNSYSGIGWVFGRFDRAWGPERPIFGKVRYMTSDSARRKLKMKNYLARWS